MIDEKDIIKLIKTGENSYVEFKEDRVDNKKLSREIVAFSNHKGGTILLGVTDSGEIAGLTRSDNEERIMSICCDSIKPTIIPTYSEIEIDGIKIGVLEIENGCNKPYYLEEKAQIDNKSKIIKTYYNRYGSTTREVMERDELQRLFQASQNLHYEVIPASYATLKDLDLSAIAQYLLDHRNTVMDENNQLALLENLDLVTSQTDMPRPTVAGLLLFGKNRVARHLPQAGIACIKISGSQITDNKDNHKFFENNIFDNFAKAVDFFNLYNTHSFEVIDVKRIDKFDYPIRAFRELLANALMHRDYTIAGSQIMIWFYDNRIEIISPGRLPNTLTIDKIRQGTKYHRNQVLAQFFYDAGIVEKLGQGIPKAQQWLKENGNSALILEERENEFAVVIGKRAE